MCLYSKDPIEFAGRGMRILSKIRVETMIVGYGWYRLI